MAETLVLTCAVADYDASTSTCTAPFYSAVPSQYPTLSPDDAMAIGLAIAQVWALAYCFRLLKRALDIG